MASAQKGNLLIYRKQSRKPACSSADLQDALLLSSDNLGNQQRGICDSWSKMAKIWLITDSFLIFVPSSNLGPTREGQISVPNQSHKMPDSN